jgi:hypothetical protein
VQRQVTARAVLADDRMVHRMPGRPALIGNGQLRSAHLEYDPPVHVLERAFSQQMLEKR